MPSTVRHNSIFILFTPNRVEPQDTFCVKNRLTGIPSPTTSSQTIAYSQAIR